MKILFDTHVLLDALLTREPFVADAVALLEAVKAGKIKGFMSATTVTDVHYLVFRQTKSTEVAITIVSRLLALLKICAVDQSTLEQALALNLPDFEDAVQIACAITSEINAITTRDVKGFTDSPVAAWLPKDLKNQLTKANEKSIDL
ncbi:MAG: PIN domain-containing protein [Cyanobacteria bacterium J06607_10]